MSGAYRPFDPAELHVAGEPDPSVAESADAMSAARELEALAVSAGVRPTDGFESRVMAAVAAEPAPGLIVRPGSEVHGGWLGAFVLAVRDAWGVVWTGGRPLAVRAQALAFVLVVVLAGGSVATAGAVTVGALLARPSGPTPSIQRGPIADPSSNETSEPSESAEPTESAEPSESAEPTETARPARTPEPIKTDDHGGGTGRGGGAGGSGGGDGSGAETPRPTETPEATGTDDHGGRGGGGETARPTETPKASDDHGGGGSDGSDGSGGGSGPG